MKRKIQFGCALLLLLPALAGCVGSGSTAAPLASGSAGLIPNTPISAAHTPASETNTPACPTPAAENEQIPEGAKSYLHGETGSRVLMSAAEIAAHNEKMKSACDALTDILAIPASVSGSTVAAYILSANAPALPKYKADGSALTEAEVAVYTENRNLKAIARTVSVRMGIVTSRANLRALPTETAFYKSAEARLYDQLQETELLVGMPVWILHTSTCGSFYYIQTYFYRGWVRTSHIAETEDAALWRSFADPAEFAVVTAAAVQVPGTDIILDMSVRLPVSEISEARCEVLLPVRNTQGMLTARSAALPRNAVSKGYLPYTKNNIYIQAFRYEGTPYGWGGAGGGVDCSSFIGNIYRTFGFLFPRNTSQQRLVIGTVVSFSEAADDAAKAAQLSALEAPAVLFRPGHVMLYLGLKDGSPYIIHAPSGGKTVTAEKLDKFSNLLSAALIS